MLFVGWCSASRNIFVKQVDVSGNQLRAAGAASLRDMLKVNTTLTELNLSNNEVGGWYEYQTWGDFTATPEGPTALAEGLAANSSVTQVHASGNDFGQAGGEAFAKALESNTHLAELVLGSKDEPASIPLKELRDNAIDSLDYSGKKLLAEGGIVLAFALKSNTSVTKVSQQHAAL